MIEVVFVIIILGIVSSIGAEIIANVYEQYILQRAQHRAALKTELAATQIANRLSYAIPGTVFRRVSKNSTAESITSPLSSNADSYTVLQWVGYDNDGFNTHDGSGTDARFPGWSGFCDLNASVGTTLFSPGSNLTLESTILSNLNSGISSAYVYFVNYPATPTQISSVSGNTITLVASPARKVEHYQLAWTSYALVVENNDLYLYHHFTATPAVSIPTATAGNRSLLMQNISTFKFRGDGDTIRFKICKTENIGLDYNISTCKEKAVF